MSAPEGKRVHFPDPNIPLAVEDVEAFLKHPIDLTNRDTAAAIQEIVQRVVHTTGNPTGNQPLPDQLSLIPEDQLPREEPSHEPPEQEIRLTARRHYSRFQKRSKK